MSSVITNNILITKNDVFPNKGSFEGSSPRESAMEDTTNNTDDHTPLIGKAHLKSDTLSGIKGLLTSDVLAQVFTIMSEAQQTPCDHIKENIVTVLDLGATAEAAGSLEVSINSSVDIITNGEEIVATEYPVTKNSFANSVTGTYAKITNMGSPKLNNNIFAAA